MLCWKIFNFYLNLILIINFNHYSEERKKKMAQKRQLSQPGYIALATRILSYMSFYSQWVYPDSSIDETANDFLLSIWFMFTQVMLGDDKKYPLDDNGSIIAQQDKVQYACKWMG